MIENAGTSYCFPDAEDFTRTRACWKHNPTTSTTNPLRFVSPCRQLTDRPGFIAAFSATNAASSAESYSRLRRTRAWSSKVILHFLSCVPAWGRGLAGWVQHVIDGCVGRLAFL